MTIQQSIISLANRGWSARKIARELGVHRATVGRYLRKGGPNPKPPSGGEGGKQCRSACEPWRRQIEEALTQGLSAQRIYQDLVTAGDYKGGYDSVKRFVRRLCKNRELPFRRMECEPAGEMQVDFGQGAWVVEADGRKRRPHLFRAVLSHSRKGYSEVVWRQTTDVFLRCLENSFRAFCGVPAVTICDNLKAGVLSADWYDPELNPKALAFADHYQTALLPSKPAMPRHKGKVEAGIDYVQENALKGRRFLSLGKQNEWLGEWERTVADMRIHGTLRQQVGQLFETAERPALTPLPVASFPSFIEVRRPVHKDGHIIFGHVRYSAPPEYLDREVWVRADCKMVRLFNDSMEPIGIHVRKERGIVTAPEHLHPHKQSALERGADHLLDRCRGIGPATGKWAAEMLKRRGIYGVRPMQGLLSLAKKYRTDHMERAAATAYERELWTLKPLRTLLSDGDTVVQGNFCQQHPIIRDLSAYKVAFPT